jgi:hypothetical protein
MLITCEQNVLHPHISLRNKVDFWVNEIRVNCFIEDIIRNDKKIRFDTEPCPVFLKNNASALKHCKFVSQAISELLVKHALKERTMRHTVSIR